MFVTPGPHSAGQGEGLLGTGVHSTQHSTAHTTRTDGSSGAAWWSSGIPLHASLQLFEPLDEVLCLPAGAALQHAQSRPHCGSTGPAQGAQRKPPFLAHVQYLPWARGRHKCRVTGCTALTLPPAGVLVTPVTVPRPRAASPAKSLVDSQSWSMTVNSTQAARRRQASAGTELQKDSHLGSPGLGTHGWDGSHYGGTVPRVSCTHKWKSSSYTGCRVRLLT